MVAFAMDFCSSLITMPESVDSWVDTNVIGFAWITFSFPNTTFVSPRASPGTEAKIVADLSLGILECGIANSQRAPIFFTTPPMDEVISGVSAPPRRSGLLIEMYTT